MSTTVVILHKRKMFEQAQNFSNMQQMFTLNKKCSNKQDMFSYDRSVPISAKMFT